IELSKGLLNAAASADKLTISARLATGAMQTLKVASSMGLALIAGIALNFVIEQITHLINAQDEAIEKGKEAAENIQATFKRCFKIWTTFRRSSTKNLKLSEIHKKMSKQ
ncbi:MAG: hypothetical protein RR355_06215, partial [Oscillospiraceae bacterium]